MKTRSIITAAALIAIFLVGYYWAFHVRSIDKVIVVVDAPIALKRIFDPSDMDAARLYFEETPNSRLQLLETYYDYDPKAAVQTFERLISDGNKFFITTQPSSMLIHSADLFEDSKALMINTSATSPVLSNKDDYILRIMPDSEVEQVAIAQFIDQLQGNRVLVLQDAANAAYTDPAYIFFKDELERLGKWNITHHKFIFDQVDPASVRQIVQAPYDALFLLAGEFQLSTGNIAQLFHRYNPEVPIVLTPWAPPQSSFMSLNKKYIN